MKKAIVLEARRSGYSIGQIAEEAITVGDLRAMLEDYDDDTLFVLSHDRGYTYGSICACDAVDYEENEDGEFEEV